MKPLSVIALVLAGVVYVACLGLSLWAVFEAQDTATQFSTDLRNGLVRSCEQNGNPLRDAVRGVLEDQIEQSKSPQLERFFPQIPPEELHAAIHAANAQRREAIRSLAPVDCAGLYPKPPS